MDSPTEGSVPSLIKLHTFFFCLICAHTLVSHLLEEAYDDDDEDDSFIVLNTR